MKKPSIMVLFSLAAILLVPFPSFAGTYEVFQIPLAGNSTSAPVTSPAINDHGQVVWSGWNGNGIIDADTPPEDRDPEIYLYDGTKTIQLTHNLSQDYYPVINNSGQVAWLTPGKDFYHNELFFYDGTAAIRLTDTANPNFAPSLNDRGQVAWSAWDGSDLEIFLYDGTGTRQITNNSSPEGSPKINAKGQIVWIGLDGSQHNQIFLYDGTSVRQLSNCRWSSWPEINDNGQVVWIGAEGDFSGSAIYLYDGTGVTKLSETTGYYWFPHINALGQVTWEVGFSSWSVGLFFYDGSSIIDLSGKSKSVAVGHSRLNDRGQVVWAGSNGKDGDIYLYDGRGGVVPITGRCLGRTFPGGGADSDINENGEVVFTTQDGIFIARPLHGK